MLNLFHCWGNSSSVMFSSLSKVRNLDNSVARILPKFVWLKIQLLLHFFNQPLEQRLKLCLVSFFYKGETI